MQGLEAGSVWSQCKKRGIEPADTCKITKKKQKNKNNNYPSNMH